MRTLKKVSESTHAQICLDFFMLFLHATTVHSQHWISTTSHYCVAKSSFLHFHDPVACESCQVEACESCRFLLGWGWGIFVGLCFTMVERRLAKIFRARCNRHFSASLSKKCKVDNGWGLYIMIAVWQKPWKATWSMLLLSQTIINNKVFQTLGNSNMPMFDLVSDTGFDCRVVKIKTWKPECTRKK